MEFTTNCRTCNQFLGNDTFCRYCGTKRGELSDNRPTPIDPRVVKIPQMVLHKCPECNTVFTSSRMGGIANYCFKCGNKLEGPGVNTPMEQGNVQVGPVDRKTSFVNVDNDFSRVPIGPGIPAGPREDGNKGFNPADNINPTVYGSPGFQRDWRIDQCTAGIPAYDLMKKDEKERKKMHKKAESRKIKRIWVLLSAVAVVIGAVAAFLLLR